MTIKINHENVFLVMKEIKSQIEKSGSSFSSFIFRNPEDFHGISIEEQEGIIFHLGRMGIISNIFPITSTNN